MKVQFEGIGYSTKDVTMFMEIGFISGLAVIGILKKLAKIENRVIESNRRVTF